MASMFTALAALNKKFTAILLRYEVNTTLILGRDQARRAHLQGRRQASFMKYYEPGEALLHHLCGGIRHTFFSALYWRDDNLHLVHKFLETYAFKCRRSLTSRIFITVDEPNIEAGPVDIFWLLYLGGAASISCRENGRLSVVTKITASLHPDIHFKYKIYLIISMQKLSTKLIKPNKTSSCIWHSSRPIHK